MAQQPKRVSESGRPAAERQFVDREEPISIFQTELKAPQGTRPLVLVFHGGAGIGKSRLRHELVRQSAVDPNVVAAALDFAIPSYRQLESALFFLRNALREAYQVRFPSFDLAYAVLWQKSHAETAMSLSGNSNDQTRMTNEAPELGLEPDSLVSQLLDESGKLPLIGLIPKVSALVESRQNAVGRDSPTSYLLPPNYYATWWRERGERELKDLPQMEPAVIVEQLPKLWAADLKEFIVHRSSFIVDRRAVLFIDSYEKLWGTGDGGRETEAGKQKTDEWVRELVKQLPEALWVISGRQKLRWEEVEKEWGDVLSQHELGGLPEHSARQFLTSCGITNEPIQDAIAKGSQGVPHYLNLAVDTFEEIRQSGQRAGSVQSLFSGAESSDCPEQLFAQFIRHLDQPAIATLQVLSASRFWNYGLFEHLVTEYQTGYPLTAYDDLSRFSFVGEGAAPETRTMHDLMREALQEHQAPELRKRVHLYLHELYAKQLEGLDVKGITDRHKAALNEAFYHGREAKSAKELWSWLDDAHDVFEAAGQYRLLIPPFREIVQALEKDLGPNHADAVTALWHFAWILKRLGDYDQAEQLLRRSLAIAEASQGHKHGDYLEILRELTLTLDARGRFAEAEAMGRRMLTMLESRPDNDAVLDGLARALIHQRKYAEAEELLRRELASREDELEPATTRTAGALDSLAYLFEEQHRFSEALDINRRLLAANEKGFGPNSPDVVAYMGNVAACLYNLGRFDEAEPLLRRVIKLNEGIYGPEHNRTARTMNTLACLLSDLGRHADAEPLSRRSLAVHEKRMGPDHIVTVRMAGNLIRALVKRGNYAEAEPMVLSAVAAREKKLGPDHPETASVIHWAGVMYRNQERYAEAEGYLRRALDIRTRMLGPEHPETLASVDAMASLDERRGRHAEAEPLYRDVLAKREKVLGSDHPEVASTASGLAGICSRDGRYAEAEALYRQALAIREKVFGPNHPFTAETLEGLSKVCEQTGRAAEAQELSARAKAIRDKNAEAAQAQAPSTS